jgi:hypothetical protein
MEPSRIPLALIVGIAGIAGFGPVAVGSTDTVPLQNWAAPRTWAPPAHGMHLMDDVSNMLPFIAVAPCRVVDTRGPVGNFGGPSLAAGVPRTFDIPGGPCNGIPDSASAYSFNVTVTNALGPGFITMYPKGGTLPQVSTLNYVAGQTIANAAVVPAGGLNAGVTVVAGVSGTDFILDINGYYSATPGNPADQFKLSYRSGSLGPLIYLENFDQSCSGSCGLSSNVSSTGAFTYAIEGVAVGASGRNAGVFGITFSTTGRSSGILGLDSSVYQPAGFVETAGVFGGSQNSLGVWGQSRNIAVAGQLLDASNLLIAYGFLGSTIGIAADSTTGPWGVFSAGNFGATGTKHFVEPHPTDPRKVILYSTVEGRTVDTTFRGTARLVDHVAVIEVPEDFRIVTADEGLTVQITPIGAYSQTWIESEDLNRIVVRGSKEVAFHYQVTGLRRAFQDLEPVQTGYVFMPLSPADRMPAYLTEEAKRRLIANGTYNADGTVNMDTAEKAGFTRIWAERAAAARATRAAAVRP